MTRSIPFLQWLITFLLPVFLTFFLFSCTGNKSEPSEGIIEIDVLQAFETQKSLNASEFIDEVELIPLESSVDSYFRYSSCYSVGEKYILVADAERAQMVLFDRKGKFIRSIGKQGKGPGELSDPREATMDPDEEFVYISDAGINKLVKYSIEGEFIKEISTSEISPSRYATGVRFINKDQFVLVNRRPYKPMSLDWYC